MKVNLFKIDDVKSLLARLEQDYIPAPKEKRIDEFRIRLYYKIIKDKGLHWQEVLESFDAKPNIELTDIRGVMLISDEIRTYALAFGYGGFTLQKYCKKEFGVGIGRKIKLISLKRQATYLYKNIGAKGSATTYKNMTAVENSPGGIVMQLSFEPEDVENFGKRIDLGKSIKISRDIDVETSLIPFIRYIMMLEEKNTIENKIPYLIKITEKSEIEDLDDLLYSALAPEKPQDISYSEMNIIGSSIYFFDLDNLEIQCKPFASMVVTDINIADIREYCEKYGIDIKTMISNGVVNYINQDGRIWLKQQIYKYLNYDIDEERAVLYEGEWFHYNDDFIELIEDKLEKIEFIYNPDYDGLFAKTKSANIEGPYLEDRINKYLDKYHRMIDVDRNMYIVDYENLLNKKEKNKYQIELADLIIDGKEFCALKRGDYKAFSYCLDQSALAAEAISKKPELLKEKYGISRIEKMSCWFLLKSDISLDESGKVNIHSINSIMLKRNIVQWHESIMSRGFNPRIRINKI